MMYHVLSSNQPDSALVQVLAERLAEDLHARGLREGDQYLTAAEAGRLLNVSTATAHRALKLLSQRGLLTRCRGRGTFVGPAAPVEKDTRIRTVCVLLPADLKEIHELRLDVLVRTVREQLDDTNVQFGFVPPEGGARFLRDLLCAPRPNSEVVGVIAISCGRQTYRTLAELKLPVVVWGTLYPGNAPLPSVDGDHRSAGYLLTRHLIERGHRRMALLNPNVVRPGQHQFFDGMSAALTEAGLPHNAMIIRMVPYDDVTLEATVREMLASPDPPTALICRGENCAIRCTKAARTTQATATKPVDVVFRDPSGKIDLSPFTHTQPVRGFSEVAREITRMLKRLCDKETLEQSRVLVPMELRLAQTED